MSARPPARILVVDDEPSILVTLDAILRRQGYRVATAVSAVAAMHLLATERFDLVLSDVSLEQQRTGFEVIDFARQSQPGIRLLLFTGYASNTMAEKARDNDVPILYKPLELQLLFDTVAGLLGERHAAEEQSQNKEAAGIETSAGKAGAGEY